MVNSVKPKNVLVVHPNLKILGGAELVALRIIALVLQRYGSQVTVLTFEGFDAKKINEYFGLGRWSGLLGIKTVKPPLVLRIASGKFHTLKIAYLHRIAKRICLDYDLCISTYNEIDFGTTGIQYIHHPNFAGRSFMRNLNIVGLTDIRETVPFLDSLYRLLVRFTARHNNEGIARNITVVNSHFMECIVHSLYGIKPTVVYPFLHVKQETHNQSWDQRKFQFLSVGRISPEKNLLELLSTFETIARQYPNAKFIILGRMDSQQYLNNLQSAAEKIKNVNIEILPDATDEKRSQLYAESKFYIHPKPYEHFGISVLEAASAGCLTFVHDSGGMIEIITSDVLRFKNVSELIYKLTRLIDDATLRNDSLDKLKSSVNNFTIENFDRGIESAINNLKSHLLGNEIL